MHTGTAGARQGGALAFVAKARANAPHLLPGPLAKGNALLDGGRHGAGELGVVLAHRIVARGHHVLGARFQIPELAQLADDALADRVEHRRDVRIRGWGLGAENVAAGPGRCDPQRPPQETARGRGGSD